MTPRECAGHASIADVNPGHTREYWLSCPGTSRGHAKMRPYYHLLLLWAQFSKRDEILFLFGSSSAYDFSSTSSSLPVILVLVLVQFKFNTIALSKCTDTQAKQWLWLWLFTIGYPTQNTISYKQVCVSLSFQCTTTQLWSTLTHKTDYCTTFTLHIHRLCSKCSVYEMSLSLRKTLISNYPKISHSSNQFESKLLHLSQTLGH